MKVVDMKPWKTCRCQPCIAATPLCLASYHQQKKKHAFYQNLDQAGAGDSVVEEGNEEEGSEDGDDSEEEPGVDSDEEEAELDSDEEEEDDDSIEEDDSED
jgi:hypothetical protein